MSQAVPDPKPQGFASTEPGGLRIHAEDRAGHRDDDEGTHGSASGERWGEEPLTHPSSRQIRVVCVDDDPLFRAVIRTVIAKTPGFRQVGEAASGEDAVTAVASLRPELVLMDVRLPGIDGFEAASRLLQSDPAPIVVLMSADPSEPLAEVDPLGASVALVSKGELCPRGLLELWERLATN